ncbi:terminal nucleotidyltransferase 4A-like [Eriocheir sinensis]|uniref:terminal nucleotidyltransferase 4A-like n=1 Tax=Eriocheir sinensis TaxID=95602 RepID=UPI0021C6E0D5|nr:terminal nucleotidyltransferase 4A-like [Eriocheir sinensis]
MEGGLLPATAGGTCCGCWPAKQHLDCLHEQVRQAEEEQAGFVRTLLVCGGLLLLLAMLAALAAVASSPPSRREGGEDTGLDVTPPDKGGDEEKQEETHLEEVKECVQERPRDTETPAATGKEAGVERVTEVGNEGEEHPSDGCVEKMGEETETEGEEGLEIEEDLEKGDTETKEDLTPTRAPSSVSPSTTTPPPANTASFLPPIPRPAPGTALLRYDGSRRALHQELQDFHRWAGGSDAEYQRRLRPVEDLRRVVVTMWPQVRVEATGSLANGLYMADSDVDATLLGHWPASPSPLLALRDALQREGVARLGQLTVLEKTTVPLVKFVHQATGLPVDVSLGSEAAVRAAELVRELLRRFPALAPISLLVRHYLRGLGLAEVFTGGVSSYAVTLMVTSFLQLQVPPDAQHDLGWLLVRFFAFYGYEFNFASTGISVVGAADTCVRKTCPS